jgi:DNA-binding MarR family transcriptional regulator
MIGIQIREERRFAMKKTVDEQLFDQIMKAPRAVRRADFKARAEEAEEKGFLFPFPRPVFARDRLLVAVSEYEGGVRQKTLTKDLDITPAAVSELVSRLENDGYVERKVDESDKRATLITLTELGAARAAEVSDEKNDRFEKTFKKLTAKEKEQLLKLLEKLTAEDDEEE